MKKHVHLVLTSMMLIAGGVWPVEGQTLAEAARREAERRSRLQGPVKTYTSADVDVRSGAGTGPSKVETIPAPPADGKPAAATPVLTDADAKTPKGDPAKVREKRDEEHWRERAKVIRDRLDRLRADAAAVEGRVAELRLALESAPGANVNALNNELQDALKELTGLQRDVRLIEQDWSMFEERARVAKIPLSWIR